MSTEKSEALVIRQADFSESSRVVTFFTREFGKVPMVARGARRLKGPFDAALDLLSVCNIVFIRKSSGGLDLLTEAKLQRRFQPRAGHLASLYGGYYLAELLDALSEDYDPHPVLYETALHTLDTLSGDTPLHLTLSRFELVLLREIGQLPALDECVLCGGPLDTRQRVGFKIALGGVICRNCLRQDTRQIAGETARVLHELSADILPEDPGDLPAPSTLQEMRKVLEAVIAHTLGHRPRTWRFLQPD